MAQRQDPHAFNVTTIADLNTVLSLQPFGDFTLQANDSVSFNMNVDQPPATPYIILSDEMMTGTAGALNYALTVTKRGGGLWRLGSLTDGDGNAVNNASNLRADAQNHFIVQAGTLELMKGSSITLQGGDATTKFELRDNTTLNARGNVNNGVVENFINAASIVLGNNVSLGFDVSNYQMNTPILTLQGNTTLADAGKTNGGQLNLLGFSNIGGIGNPITVQLLSYSYAETVPEEDNPIPSYAAPPIRITDLSLGQADKAATYGINYRTLVRGENWDDVVGASGGRLAGTWTVNPATPTGTTGQVMISLTDFWSSVGEVQWNADSGNWNATEQNWTGEINGTTYDTFLHGDIVTFSTDVPGPAREIAVQAGGVQIGNWKTGGVGMTVESGIYRFRNESNSLIGIDGPGMVRITAPELPNGQYDTRRAADVTFHSANSYWGGTEILNSSTLTLGSTGAVGTGMVTMKSKATLIFNIEKTDPGIPDADFQTVFYNLMNAEAGTTIIKRDPYDLTLEGGFVANAGASAADTIVENGILRKYIAGGVLTVNEGAAYHTLGYYEITGAQPLVGHNRTIAGLNDGTLGGGTVDMNAFTLTIITSELPENEFYFSGLITGIGPLMVGNNPITSGARIVKEGIGTQVFGNDQNDYPSGTDVKAGALVGRFTLTSDLARYRPFGSGAINVSEDAKLIFDLTGENPGDAPEFAATLSNTINGEGEIHVGYERPGVDPDTLGGAQILHLSGQSTYTGPTYVNKGKLRVSNVLSTGQTSKVTLGTHETALQFMDMNDSTYDNPYDRIIVGEGDVEVIRNTTPQTGADPVPGTNVYVRGFYYQRDYNGNYLLDEDGARIPSEEKSSYTGITYVKAEEDGKQNNLHLLDNRATGYTEAVVLEAINSNLYLDFGSMTDANDEEIEQIYDRHITGEGNLFKDYAGTAVLELDGSEPKKPNNYTGKTNVLQGTLKLNYAAATGVASALGGGNVAMSRNAILELAFYDDYEKDITGQGILAKSGAGTVSTLKGYSDYTGGTHIYGGTLSYSNLDPNTPGNLGIGGVSFMKGGGTLQNRLQVDEFTQQVLIYAGSTANFETLADLTVTGDYGISHVDVEGSTATSNFIKSGDAVMTIDTGVVTWTGFTTVEAGILRNNIPDNTALTVMTSAKYETGGAHRRVSGLYGDGIVETTANYNFTVNNAEADTFGGRIIGGGNLVKTDKGTLYLLGFNNYTGSTRIEEGIVVGTIASGTDLTVNSSGTYKSGGSPRQIGSLSGSGTVDMEKASLTIHHTKGDEAVFRGVILNGERLTKSGAGTQTFAGRTYDFSDNVTIEGGTLRIGGVASTSTNFSTDGGLNISPAGTLFLDTRGNVHVDKTLAIDGTLKVNVGNNLITAGAVTIGDEAILNVVGINSSEQNVLIIQSETAILDDFNPANVYIAGESSGVDFLEVGVEKSTDLTKLYVGQTFVWYKSKDAHGNFTLNNADGEFTIDIALNDVTGTFDPKVWDGKTLTKYGPGTLILSAENGYTGATDIRGGTLKLVNEKATNGSSGINLLSDISVLEIDFDSRDAAGKWTAGLTTGITGTGNLVKTGHDSIAVLGGKNTFTGQTYVNQGVLLLDGTSTSYTWVREDAGFGGNGTLSNSISFEDGSSYYWRFDGTKKGSDTLNVTGKVFIGNDVLFRPMATVTEDKLGNFSGLTVIGTTGGVSGQFAGIEAGTNPFYMYELDYSDSRSVKVSGFLRDTPLALSDIVAASLTMAQTRMYRTAFQQIAREWMSECPQHGQAGSAAVRGQLPAPQRTAWMNFIGRGGDMASSYFKHDYDFQSYGVQAGLSLVSNCTRSAGILFGREESKLSNHSDIVRGEDYYLGFYYGQVFASGYDMRAYIGGGWQKNRLERTSNGYRYNTRYNGNTYNTNIEFGRRFTGQRDWLIRPYVGADLNVTWIGSSMEKSIDLPDSNEYRGYGRSDLAQFFVRAGIEATKSWRLLDFRAGTQLRWNFGDAKGWTRIYYPSLEGTGVSTSVNGHGCDLGRFEWGVNFGVNWFLTERRNTLFFLDYDADMYFDRDGDPTNGTGTVGFVWRF